MMKDIKFLKCKKGDSTYIGMDESTCDESRLEVLKANSLEASLEKHIPYITFIDDMIKVSIGSIEHPMLPEHHIVWIFIETKTGGILHRFKDDDKPEAIFKVDKNDVVKVSEYCNVHGLWNTDFEVFKSDDTVCSADFSSGCLD